MSNLEDTRPLNGCEFLYLPVPSVSTPLVHPLVFSVCYDPEIEGDPAANQRVKALQSIGGKKKTCSKS